MLPRFSKDASIEEAYALFERYVAEVPAALDRLRDLLARSTDPRFHSAVLDLSPGSLATLWEYVLLFLDRFRRRTWSQRFLSSIGFKGLVAAADPRDPASIDRVLADPDLRDLLDHVACYLGEAFRRSFPGSRHRLGSSSARGRTSLYGRLPVVADLPWEREACPDAIVTRLARRALRMESAAPQARAMLREALEDYRRPPRAEGRPGPDGS